MRLSQADLAGLIDVSRAAVSQATARGHKCGGYPVRAWAVYDGAGRVAGYDVPDHIMRQRHALEAESLPDDAPEDRKEAEAAAPPSHLEEAASGILTEERIRDIIRTEIPRENPKPERREDYIRPVAAGGLSYVMAEAVRGDSGTARAGVLCAAALFGGLLGHEASDHWGGALAGAVLIGGLGWQAMRSGAPVADAGSEADAPASDTAPLDADPSPLGTVHAPHTPAGTHQRPVHAVGT